MDEDGPADYATIQAAVNDASSGDAIIVNPGIYPGNITITVPDLVLVSSNQYNATIRATENAFNLNADNITIKSFNIIGSGSSGYSGVIDSSFFCTIQNNKISNFHTGIGVYNGNEGGSGSIINNYIFDCSDGILLWSSNDNKLSGNKISNCETGLDMVDSYGTLIYNNNFNNTRNVQFIDISTWNTTKTPGKNIVGGPYIGGNYWATPAEDGFSQTNSDANEDGFADVPYKLNEVNIDYLPLVAPAEKPATALPVANSKTNTTSGNAPLSVLFTDLSQDATSRSWDVNNDGIEDSNEASFVHVYEVPGNYNVNLTVSNLNGTSSKTTTIDVERKSSGESSSGVGGGGSPEPARNVGTKELSQVFITNGKAVKFGFTKNATCVVYVSFDAKNTVGKTTTIVEELKDKSALVSELPAGEVYKFFNVWVGNSGFATSKNIENPVICFKVEKSWIKAKKVGQTSITLNRYSDRKWEPVPTSFSGEDKEFLYFTSKVPAFSSFAITGKAKSLSGENASDSEPEQETRLADEEMKNLGEEVGQSAAQEGDTKAPGFEIVYGIICLFAIFLYKRK